MAAVPVESAATEAPPAEPEADDVAAIDELREAFGRVRTELARVIQGQEDVIERLLTCILARGHGLLMGVPGLAKTLMVHSLAQTMDLSFSRIQFTPDLMPSDITGTDILQEAGGGHREFEFVQGPVFANIVLADEINRTPPKTQAALLEAMQERMVTVVGRTYELDRPFFVLATQNPIEQEGTYPLPEAQLDRFMFFIRVNYPKFEEEMAIARFTTGDDLPSLDVILPGEKIMEYQRLVRRVPVPDHVYDYVVRLVRLSRPGPEAPDWVNSWITWGAGPRAVQYLILGGKARAALAGNYMVGLEDVKAVTNEVLTHRMQLTFHAESEGVTTLDIVERLMSEVNGDS
ncbi:MAG: AAA family ATPase [Victivallales bacterium]|nr:AAA family ATPase [Victivallales bacterium]